MLESSESKDYRDSEDSGRAGRDQDAEDRLWAQPWHISRLTGSLAVCRNPDNLRIMRILWIPGGWRGPGYWRPILGGALAP